MIWYEVRAEVPAGLAAAFEAYLREEHIPDLMETGCFVEASFCRAEAAEAAGAAGAVEAAAAAGGGSGSGSVRDESAEAPPAPRVHFRSAYLAQDRGALDRYFAEHARRLREHALSRFPEGLTFTREEWAVRERWGGETGGVGRRGH